MCSLFVRMGFTCCPSSSIAKAKARERAKARGKFSVADGCGVSVSCCCQEHGSDLLLLLLPESWWLALAATTIAHGMTGAAAAELADTHGLAGRQGLSCSCCSSKSWSSAALSHPCQTMIGRWPSKLSAFARQETNKRPWWALPCPYSLTKKASFPWSFRHGCYATLALLLAKVLLPACVSFHTWVLFQLWF